MKKRFTEEQIVGFLREAASGVAVKELCRKHGFSDASFYTWRSKYGGLEVSDVRRPLSQRATGANRVHWKRQFDRALLGNAWYNNWGHVGAVGYCSGKCGRVHWSIRDLSSRLEKRHESRFRMTVNIHCLGTSGRRNHYFVTKEKLHLGCKAGGVRLAG